MTDQSNARILVVDDDTDGLEVLETRLTHAGYEVETADSAEKALARVKAFDPGMIVTDVRMSGMTGLELLEKVRGAMEDVEVVVMTAHDDMETAVSAMKLGAFDFLVKPVDPKAIQALADRCFRERALAESGGTPEALAALPRSRLVGRDPRMIDIYKTIGVLAANRATVLIRGETGTGKEVIARGIHENSLHIGEPFIAVNCTALTDTLLESELFGHVKGAFTGATTGRKGYFELAGKGTIFLDEIGELPIGVQAKLLRMLQEQEVRAIGAVAPTSVNVRVLAATNRDLVREVQERTFRKDLYYRLNVITITVPPLRERREDVPTLVRHFISRHAVHSVTISDGAMRGFVNYDWPGNVRELQNMVRRLVVMKSDPVIRPDDLPDDLRDAPEAASPGIGRGGLVLPLAELERRHILHTIELTKGDRDAAALMLGIGRSTLYRKLKAYEGAANGVPVQTSLFPLSAFP